MNWGYNAEIFYKYNLLIPIKYSISTHCHALLTGASGSGKSYALLYLLGMLLKSHPDIIVFFLDFKNSEDFRFLESYQYFYSGDTCYHGIIDYYRLFTEIRNQNESRARYLVICDEYPSLINYYQMKDKKEKTAYSNDILSAISEVLMLGRGNFFGAWLITQRADNTLFANGSRDNLMIKIGLGKLSREQIGMIFTAEDIPNKMYKQGEGILLADGHELVEVKYPRIQNLDEWKQHILSALNRNT